MSDRLRIYVAGPISKGSLTDNIHRACEAGKELIAAGYAPFIPHLTCYLGMGLGFDRLPGGTVAGIPPETWYDVDLPWVRVADALLRLPGESTGADLEVEEAFCAAIPVYKSVEHLHSDREHIRRRREERNMARQCCAGPGPEPATPAKAPAGDARFHHLLKQIGDLHDAKQADYGAAGDPFANVRASERFGIPPWVGAVLRGNDKMARIQSFIANGRLKNESVEDSLMDLAVYALIGLVLYREQAEQDGPDDWPCAPKTAA